MINNYEHFGGIFGKAGSKSKDKKKLTESQLRLLDLNCKDKFGTNTYYDNSKKKCIKNSRNKRR